VVLTVSHEAVGVLTVTHPLPRGGTDCEPRGGGCPDGEVMVIRG
jgi:hypothetical protein